MKTQKKKIGELPFSIHCKKKKKKKENRKGRFWLQMIITLFGTKAMSNKRWAGGLG